MSFLLWPRHFILSEAICSCTPLFPSSPLHTCQPGSTHLLVSYLFAFLCSPWFSHSNYTGVVCHSLLQWVTFCQNSPSVQSVSSVAQSCPTLCDPMNRSTPGLPVHHQLPKFTQTHVHRVSDAIQPSQPLSSPSPPAPNPSQHQSLFQ